MVNVTFYVTLTLNCPKTKEGQLTQLLHQMAFMKLKMNEGAGTRTQDQRIKRNVLLDKYAIFSR